MQVHTNVPRERLFLILLWKPSLHSRELIGNFLVSAQAASQSENE